MIPTNLIIPILVWEARLYAWLLKRAVWLVFAPVFLGWRAGALWAQRPSAWRQVTTRSTLTLTAVAVLGPVTLCWHVDRLAAWVVSGSVSTAVLAWGLWWLGWVPAAVVMARFRVRSEGDALAGGRIDPVLADVVRSAAWEARLVDLSQAAGVDVISRPPQVFRLEVGPEHLGVAAKHDTRRSHERAWTRRESRAAKSSWTAGARPPHRLVLPNDPPRVVMLGGSGSGKTVAQHRMVMAGLERGWRVLWLDGKGDPRDAQRLLHVASADNRATRWLNLSAADGNDSYNMWRGDGSAVARKAAALMPRSGVSGTEHFAAWELYALSALADPPWRSSLELRERMRTPASYVGFGDAGRSALATLTAKQHGTRIIDTVAAQVAAALTPLARYVDGQHGQPWSLDDDTGWDLAVASIDPGAVAGAERVAAAILMDLDAYRVARRTRAARPLLVIADEIGAMVGDPRVSEIVPRLMEQVRSQRIGLIVAAQSVGTLGEYGSRLLSAGVDLWVGRVDAPDEVAMLIGTSKVTEQAHQGDEHGALLSGRTAAREQDALMVHPQILRELPPWTWLVKEPRTEPRWAIVPPLAP